MVGEWVLKDFHKELLMMNCFHSMAPNDEELLRHALDQETLSKETQEHLEQCSICQQRLAQYKDVNLFLLSRLYRSQCPDTMQLNLYCAHMLPPEEVMDIAEHLALCPLCTNEARDIRYTLVTFEPFPVEAQYSSVRTFQRIIAALVPWQPQLVTRDGSTTNQHYSWPRQYRAGSLNISLHLSRASNGDIILLGLVSSVNNEESLDDLEGVPVELYRAFAIQAEQNSQVSRKQETTYDTPLMCTSIDDLGNLVFKAVPEGVYTMVIRLPEREIIIEGLTIEHG
jgi:hypothetical protein